MTKILAPSKLSKNKLKSMPKSELVETAARQQDALATVAEQNNELVDDVNAISAAVLKAFNSTEFPEKVTFWFFLSKIGAIYSLIKKIVEILKDKDTPSTTVIEL